MVNVIIYRVDSSFPDLFAEQYTDRKNYIYRERDFFSANHFSDSCAWELASDFRAIELASVGVDSQSDIGDHREFLLNIKGLRFLPVQAR